MIHNKRVGLRNPFPSRREPKEKVEIMDEFADDRISLIHYLVYNNPHKERNGHNSSGTHKGRGWHKLHVNGTDSCELSALVYCSQEIGIMPPVFTSLSNNSPDQVNEALSFLKSKNKISETPGGEAYISHISPGKFVPSYSPEVIDFFKVYYRQGLSQLRKYINTKNSFSSVTNREELFSKLEWELEIPQTMIKFFEGELERLSVNAKYKKV